MVLDLGYEIRKKERRTYLSGLLVFKCRLHKDYRTVGYHNVSHFQISKTFQHELTLDHAISDLHELQADLTEIHGNSYFDDRIRLSRRINVRLNNRDGGGRYQFDLHETKFMEKPSVSKVKEEDNMAYATWTCKIVAYLKDYSDELVPITPTQTHLFQLDSNVNECSFIVNGQHVKPKEDVVVEEGEVVNFSAPKDIESVDGRRVFNSWSDGTKTVHQSVAIHQDFYLSAKYDHVPPVPKTGLRSRDANSRRKDVPFNGCLSGLFGVLSLAFIIFWIVTLLSILGTWVWLFLLVPTLIWLLLRYIGPIAWIVRKILPYLAIIVLLGALVGSLYASFVGIPSYTPHRDDSDEVSTSKLVPRGSGNSSVARGTDTLLVNHRKWTDYDGIVYEADIAILSSAKKLAAYHRIYNAPPIGPDLGADLYESLIYFDNGVSDPFNLIYKMLDSIRLTNELNEQQFAFVITSMVQDIPYSLILDGQCDPSSYTSSFVIDYLNQGKACYGGVKHGIFSPEEFLSSLIGDCDTRTIALYKLLDHYDYKVAIFNSPSYGHSVLGISLPIVSEHFYFSSTAFAICETTEPGIRPGTPLPDMERDQWYPVLTNIAQ